MTRFLLIRKLIFHFRDLLLCESLCFFFNGSVLFFAKSQLFSYPPQINRSNVIPVLPRKTFSSTAADRSPASGGAGRPRLQNFPHADCSDGSLCTLPPPHRHGRSPHAKGPTIGAARGGRAPAPFPKSGPFCFGGGGARGGHRQRTLLSESPPPALGSNSPTRAHFPPPRL